jgi:integrase
VGLLSPRCRQLGSSSIDGSKTRLLRIWPVTYATYKSHVKNYIEPGIGAMRLDRLRVADVQAWLNRLATQCQCCAQGKDARRARHGTARCCAVGQCCHRVASPRTVKDIRTVLRSGLNSAVRQELLDRNVAQLVQIPKQRKRKLVAWTSEEARRFLESARSDSDPLYAAYVLVLVLGLRTAPPLILAPSTGSSWGAVRPRECVGSLFMMPGTRVPRCSST